LQEKIFCDSAGTAAYHSGERADQRSMKHGKRRGYDLTSISRKIYPSQDFEQFDYILAMDSHNMRDIRKHELQPGELDGKLFLMCHFCATRKETEVPDPYYEGVDGFEVVLDILEDACEGLLAHIRKTHGI
jgi:protein-tyrosine phosphatase